MKIIFDAKVSIILCMTMLLRATLVNKYLAGDQHDLQTTMKIKNDNCQYNLIDVANNEDDKDPCNMETDARGGNEKDKGQCNIQFDALMAMIYNCSLFNQNCQNCENNNNCDNFTSADYWDSMKIGGATILKMIFM